MNTPSVLAEDILTLLRERGDSQYGSEAVSQLEHALQTAVLAEQAGSDSALITAALLHDVGHLLHDLPDDAPEHGIDDRHEVSGGRWLEERFGPQVAEPVRLHVAAKRYLCAVEPAYRTSLSGPSELSLQLQGGPMTEDEVQDFESHPFFEQAVCLRRWDDEAKVPDRAVPDVGAFRIHLETALGKSKDP